MFSSPVLGAAKFSFTWLSLATIYALDFPTLTGVTTGYVSPSTPGTSIEAEVAKTIVVASDRVVEHIVPA